ncbi:MAG: hypothetical protein ACK56E_02765, partial [Planctomyces sp.]
MSLRTFLTQVLQLLKGERREQPAAAAAPRPAARPIRFTRLEDRRVFNASFVLNAAGLTVDNVTAPGALQVSEGPGDLQFQLGSGMGEWIGNTAPGISILNNGTLLSVQESLLQGPGPGADRQGSGGREVGHGQPGGVQHKAGIEDAAIFESSEADG